MQLLRTLPKIDKFITLKQFTKLNPKLVAKISRREINALREDILSGKIDSFCQNRLIDSVLSEYNSLLKDSLHPLINATGVILHTNMGRSPIGSEILQKATETITAYSNLEYNQTKGCRGERYQHISRHLCALLGVEDVLVVNNNASAVFLILNTFAKGKEVVVSRGELVEIGGSFRIPEVMSQSGAILREVGATNKTNISDYSSAIDSSTAMLMKVHKSNFTIEGFSDEVPYAKIQKLAKDKELIDYYDVGSGYIPSLPYNLGANEPSLIDILSSNPSLVSFSGDKLFGSVQAGIIVGKKELINKLKKNQLLRMLRVDKVNLSILEQTAKAYLEERYDLIPALRLLFTDIKELQKRANSMRESIGTKHSEVMPSTTYMGGGTLPNREFPTIVLHIYGKATVMERTFRERGIIGRIDKDRFLIDLRALEPKYDDMIVQVALDLLQDA